MHLAIVERAQQGDRDAFETLAEETIERLYAIASLVLHDSSLAEDAVQETLIRTWRDLPRLRQPERFDAWQRQILVHACVDLARRRRHVRHEVSLPMALNDASRVEEEVIARDAVTEAFSHLGPVDRSAIVLRHYLGCSVAEVADAMRIPLGTAKSRLHRAERAMRHALEPVMETAGEGGAT